MEKIAYSKKEHKEIEAVYYCQNCNKINDILFPYIFQFL